jgi:ribosomal protein S18 acetylase RimI-like enzyme
MNEHDRPVLYVTQEEPTSQQAIALLREAGFEIEIRVAPTYYRAAYGTPVLFGLFNKFEGVEGVQIFLDNAKRSCAVSGNGIH